MRERKLGKGEERGRWKEERGITDVTRGRAGDVRIGGWDERGRRGESKSSLLI